MHGEGSYIWADGRSYKGRYSHDKKEGFGVYVFANGYVYYGQWENGQQHGEGTKIQPNNEMQKSIWQNGKVQSSLEISEAERADILEYMKGLRKEMVINRRNKLSAGQKLHKDKHQARRDSIRQSITTQRLGTPVNKI